MLISVVTATYNRENTVRDAVESLYRQTYANFEHIVQDGGSTDKTLAQLHAMKRDKTHILSEKDGGLYDALNKGIKRATGDVIGLMHSDDFFASDHVLEKISEAFQDPAIDGLYGDLQYISATDPERIIRHWRAGSYSPNLLRRGWMPPHPTLYLRREVFERWGYYDTQFQIAADYDAMLRYLVRGEINLAYIPEVLVKMRVGGESNKSIGRIIQKSREDYRALRRNNVGGLGTLALKNFSKLGQFFIRSEDKK